MYKTFKKNVIFCGTNLVLSSSGSLASRRQKTQPQKLVRSGFLVSSRNRSLVLRFL